MKRVVLGVSLWAVLLTTGAATGQEWEGDLLQEEGGNLHALVGITWDSKYIWRGFDVFDDESATHLMADLNLFGTGFGVSAVGHRANGGGFEDRERWDGTAYYQGGILEGDYLATNFRVGYVYYYYPELNEGEAMDMHEGQLVLSWPNISPIPGLQPSYVLIYTDAAPRSRDVMPYEATGWIQIGMLDYSFAIPGVIPEIPEHIITLHSELIYNGGVTYTPIVPRNDWTVVYPNPDHDLSHAVFGASTDFAFGEAGNLIFTPAVYYQITMEGTINEDDSEFWVSLGLKYTF